MACGVPVVQPNHGAFPEIIERTGGGLLAKSASGADVADALYDVWKDPARAAEMGRRGAEGVRRHYTVTHMAENVLRIYQEVVNERRGGTFVAEARVRSPAYQSMLEANHLSKSYATPAGELAVLARRVAVAAARRGRVRDGAVGVRQEHAALHSWRPRAADQRHDAPARHRSLHARRPTRWRRFAIATSASCCRITACCRSAPCSRTCWCRRWSARPTPAPATRARTLLGAGRAHRSPASSAGGIVRRREAARRHRPRAGAATAPAVVRRADRQSRCGNRRRSSPIC